MILFIEGPRHSGKTYLINNFLSVCNDPRIEYYKFYFANHIKMLDLVKLDDSAALHYFSLGNIMTIMEMNFRPEYRDKIWIFDRAILSAYTWAILRDRLSIESAKSEYSKLVSSELFSNCKTLMVSVTQQTDDITRVKDTWDGIHSTSEEQEILVDLFNYQACELNNQSKLNLSSNIVNNFDINSTSEFNIECFKLLGIEANK